MTDGKGLYCKCGARLNYQANVAGQHAITGGVRRYRKCGKCFAETETIETVVKQ